MELIIDIFNDIPDIKTLKNINKSYRNAINALFCYYNNKFDSYVKHWKNHLHELVKLLINKNDIKSIIFLFNNYKQSVNIINYYAAYYNKQKLFELLPLQNKKEIMKGAIAGVKIEIVKQELKNGTLTPQETANYAAVVGSNELAKYIIQKYQLKDYNEIALNAAIGNNLELIEYAIENGANNYIEIAKTAASYGYINIVEYIVKNFGTGKILEIIGKEGAAHGFLDIVIYAINMGAYNINEMAYEAALNGYINIIEYLNDLGVKQLNFDQIALYGVKGGYLYVVNYAVAMGAKNLNEILYLAAEYGRLDIIKHFSQYLNKKLADVAFVNGHVDVANYIRQVSNVK